MIHYKRVQVESKRVVSCTCNKCGRVVDFGEHDYQIEVDFTTIKNTYRYGSSKDGTKYTSHVCEPCMDAFYAGFAISPQITDMVEWGSEPADPVVFLEPACDECGGDLGGNSIGRLEEHDPECSKFPF